ncbi:MAG: hypothetical protein MHMPM18_001647 [Marteilia pararefringens]
MADCLTKSLSKCIGETVKIELKDRGLVQGTIIGADASMNLHLKNCEIVDRFGHIAKESIITIRGNAVGMVIFSEKLNLASVLSFVSDSVNKKKAAKTVTSSAALGIRATKSSSAAKRPKGGPRH